MEYGYQSKDHTSSSSLEFDSKISPKRCTNEAPMSKNTRKLNSKKFYLIKKNRTVGKKASFVVKKIINQESATDI